MAKETITKNEHLQLMGLEVLIRRHTASIEDLRGAVADLLGVERNDDYLSDFIYADQGLEQLFRDLNVRLEDPAEAIDANPELHN